jgi:hypothetical protein
MKKLLNHCKNFILGLSDGIQAFRSYKVGKVK